MKIASVEMTTDFVIEVEIELSPEEAADPELAKRQVEAIVREAAEDAVRQFFDAETKRQIEGTQP